ncbi:MAG: NAD(P)H-quinone oxidoreductase subunit 5 [Marinobacter excellens HL-55]|uniref:Probable inorganic carbon transporter subunit DabB n=1 Tax=Marinobacter excellens HL-55 TaxID=1305731 RepID=A0A0P7ZDQ2_9GAMM|nr:MAG: NAD(P)H-quinone oxidoreductase subunit 5 [Marinobacter excellens HL-55]
MFDSDLVQPFFLILIPVFYLVGAITTAVFPSQSHTSGGTWAFGFAFASAIVSSIGGWWWPGTATWLNLAPLAQVMVLLVTLLGLILARFAKQYLEGEPGQSRFMIWLHLTLTSVALITTTNHLLIFLGSWIAISTSLHQLLMFYPERPRAALAAHKKFIFARLAELCLIAAFTLLYASYDTLFISQILTMAAEATNLPPEAKIAALLMAVAALLKCAQLPFHGWLIQVVEAPTPVSALLHAGVVNLGGFLMILMAPLISQVSSAQWLLLVIAGPTAVFASLVMMTRISIKVRLAWSTCAQMGWMLVECALGLYELALLHLVAHSAYKAHAFLNAGNTVESTLKKRLVAISNPGWREVLPAAFLALILSVASILVSNSSGPAQVVSWVVPGIALTILLSEMFAVKGGVAFMIRAVVLGAAFWTVYWVQKTASYLLLTPPDNHASLLAISFTGLLLTMLIIGYFLVRYRRHSPLGIRFHRFLFAAAYLDEWATRLTLKIWPVKLPNVVQPRSVVPIAPPARSKESV